MTSDECPFCRLRPGSEPLWESEHYRIIPDGFPRCAGHVLLISRDHLASQMHAPKAYLDEFRTAHERMRQFLLATSGRAAFYENGARNQEVPHAHLHGLPFEPRLPPEWLRTGALQSIASWRDAREERKRQGYYFYLETAAGQFLVKSYKQVLAGVRNQLVDQTEARIDPTSGKMVRGGTEMVARTVGLWREWEKHQC